MAIEFNTTSLLLFSCVHDKCTHCSGSFRASWCRQWKLLKSLFLLVSIAGRIKNSYDSHIITNHAQIVHNSHRCNAQAKNVHGTAEGANLASNCHFGSSYENKKCMMSGNTWSWFALHWKFIVSVGCISWKSKPNWSSIWSSACILMVTMPGASKSAQVNKGNDYWWSCYLYWIILSPTEGGEDLQMTCSAQLTRSMTKHQTIVFWLQHWHKLSRTVNTNTGKDFAFFTLFWQQIFAAAEEIPVCMWKLLKENVFFFPKRQIGSQWNAAACSNVHWPEVA